MVFGDALQNLAELRPGQKRRQAFRKKFVLRVGHKGLFHASIHQCINTPTMRQNRRAVNGRRLNKINSLITGKYKAILGYRKGGLCTPMLSTRSVRVVLRLASVMRLQLLVIWGWI